MGDEKDNKDGSQSPGQVILDTSFETVILSLDIVGKEAGKIDQQVEDFIQNVLFQEKIEKALDDCAAKLMQKYNTGQTITAKDVNKVVLKSAEDAGKKLAQELGKTLKQQIENSASYQELEEKLKAAQKDLEKLPVGVWFTDTKVYIIAAGVIVNGAAAAFVTSLGVKKLGESVALKMLDGQMVKWKPLGEIDLSFGVSKVDPKKDLVDFKVSGTKDWKPIKLTLDLVGHSAFKELTKFKSATGGATLSVPVTKNFEIDVHSAAEFMLEKDKSPQRESGLTGRLGVGITVKPDSGTLKFGGEVFIERSSGSRRPGFGAQLNFFSVSW